MENRKSAAVAIRAAVLLALCAVGGCRATNASPFFVKPTVTVLPFEDARAVRIAPDWDLSDAMSRWLSQALVEKKGFVVVETERFDETSPIAGQARYRIRISLDQFEHVKRPEGLVTRLTRLAGRSDEDAVVRLTVIVEDARRPDVLLCRETVEAAAPVRNQRFPHAYKGLSLGDALFRHTPLGRATDLALNRAVRVVERYAASERWRPRIVRVKPDGTLIVNGGRDRLVRAGTVYAVTAEPASGSRPLAHVEIVRVDRRHSVARILRGGPVNAGQELRPAR